MGWNRVFKKQETSHSCRLCLVLTHQSPCAVTDQESTSQQGQKAKPGPTLDCFLKLSIQLTCEVSPIGQPLICPKSTLTHCHSPQPCPCFCHACHCCPLSSYFSSIPTTHTLQISGHSPCPLLSVPDPMTAPLPQPVPY